MNKTILALALAAASALSFGTASAADHGFYAGVNVGHSAINADTDKSGGTSGGAFVGYQYNKNLAVETGYTRFADVRDAGANVHLEAVTVQGVARTALPYVNKASVFAKAGVGYTRAFGDASDHRFVPTVAVGVDYALTKEVSLRAEHQYLRNFADSDVAVRNTVVGVNYKF